MLRTLYIRDYALIEELEVEFESGLNILTGETGAGKSIIVGALKLILGERATTDLVRSGTRKAVIEGIFEEAESGPLITCLETHDIEPGPCVIMRRELTPTYSRAFINDTATTLPVMREVASQLIDLHGQHEHQSLLRADKHLDLLDSFGGLGALVANYAGHYRHVASLAEERDELAGQEMRLREQHERLAFEIGEIDVVDPQSDEQERLENERRILENAERLYEATASLYEMLYAREGAVNDQLVVARNELRDIARVDNTFESALEEIRSAQIIVSEIATLLQDYNARIEFSPDRLETIRDRWSDLEGLKRKYGGSLEAVLEHRKRIGRLYELAENYEESLRVLEARLREAMEDLSGAAMRLSAKRHEVAEHIEQAIGAELYKLGMPKSRLHVTFSRREDRDGWIRLPVEGRKAQGVTAYMNGMDRVSFHIATNVGEDPKPLARVASGGEISRIMLALKTILAKNDRLPILVFDEIDSGISGAIARKVGESMRQLAQYHQIIAITHLPQIAALADTHYAVEKHVAAGRATTAIRRLEETERAEHIAALITGPDITEASLKSARELMVTAK